MSGKNKHNFQQRKEQNRNQNIWNILENISGDAWNKIDWN